MEIEGMAWDVGCVVYNVVDGADGDVLVRFLGISRDM